MKERVQLLGSSSYAETFKRYCTLRERYERDDIYVRTYREDDLDTIRWDTGRLEAQRLFALASKLQLDVHLMEYVDSYHSPRTEGMGFGKIVAFHSRYGFNETELRKDGFENMDELEAYLLTPEDKDFKELGPGMGAVVLLPFYMHDHGGLAFSTTSFNDPWDSGQLGFIFATKEDIDEHEIANESEAIERLRREVELFDIYQRGELYEYVVHLGDLGDWEAIDDHGESCDGFFYEKDARAEGERTLKQKREALRMAASVLMPQE